MSATVDQGADEDGEYLSIVWGILKQPIACTQCGKLTRQPVYSGTEIPICGVCFRISIWGR